MSTPMSCPSCRENLTGDTIPEEWRAAYGGASNYTQAIGIYDRGVDRTIAWQCPVCGYEWERP